MSTQHDADHQVNAVRVEDLIIDELTGEVLDLPENAGDLIELLTYRLTTLQESERAYKQAIVLLKLALKRELERLDLKSLQTQYGRPSIRSRTTRKAGIARLYKVMAEYELSKEQIEGVIACAVTFDPDGLDLLADSDIIPREAIEALIEETTIEYVQVAPVLKEPPKVEKV
ncbi:MAG: hypothetical protein V3U27_21505 [Candidatus Tectomicrobia bacterium]